jgi:flagellar biosynthesis/type III secretory pathway M-ring protein FliF/YscJ
MHPEDANLLRKIFSLENQPSSSWSIAEDPSIARGGCMVTTETSKIDATIEKRISEIFAHVFGDLRALANDKADEAINLTSQSSSKHQEDSQQPFHTEPSADPQSTHTENRNSDEGQQHGLQPQDDSNSNLRQDPLEFGKEPDENG